MDRQTAQQRADRIHVFRGELEELERSGVLSLSAEQRAAIEQHHRAMLDEFSRAYDVDTSEDTAKLSIAMKIASALGGLAFCIALGLLVERYWSLMDTWVQVALLIVAPLVAIAAAELASRRERTLYFTSLLCLVALAAFYMDLTTLGQLFSLTPSPGAFAAWCALALLFAYRYQLRLPLLIGLMLLLALVPMWLLFFAGYEWQNPFARPEIVIGAGLLLGWWAARQRGPFAPVIRGVAVGAVLMAIFALSKWGYGSFLPADHKTVESLYTLACFAASGTAIAIGIRRQWEETMLLASLSFAAFLMMKMYDWLWETVPAFVFFALIGALSLALLYAFRRVRETLRERTA